LHPSTTIFTHEKLFYILSAQKYFIPIATRIYIVRILWFSWRDIQNPEAGGAEVFTYEVMQKLIKRGYSFTLFTSGYQDAPLSDNINGINVIRQGGKYTVYSKAKKYYAKNRSIFDLVVDEINVKPFLTPKFVNELPVVGLVHQVSRGGLFYEIPFPVNYIMYYYLIKRWLSNYRNTPTITVSESQKRILQEFGFQAIYLVPEGLSVTPLVKMPKKETKPTVAFIGRLKGYKLPDHALRAFALIKKELPDARMFVIGDGYMRLKLERMNVKDVTFYGKVDNQTKCGLLSKAHLVLVPSVEEGWGLVVTESNAMGTPTVAYDVSGLRDSVKDGQTGILVNNNSPEGLAAAALKLLKDEESLAKLSQNALSYSKQFSWNRTADAFDIILKAVSHQSLKKTTN
jgi:glycosyltransferase involved in cell wall biosynthesis